MQRLRELLSNSPWIGWIVAAAFLGLSVVIYLRLSGSNDAYSVERMSEMVTIKCIETGDEWEMTRGLMEQQLRRRGGTLTPTDGIMNPNTGRPTGFPFNKSEWERTIERINREKASVTDRRESAPQDADDDG
jgi:hypothetical protein